MKFYCEIGDLSNKEVNQLLIDWCDKFSYNKFEGLPTGGSSEEGEFELVETVAYKCFGVDKEGDSIIADERHFVKMCPKMTLKQVKEILYRDVAESEPTPVQEDRTSKDLIPPEYWLVFYNKFCTNERYGRGYRFNITLRNLISDTTFEALRQSILLYKAIGGSECRSFTLCLLEMIETQDVTYQRINRLIEVNPCVTSVLNEMCADMGWGKGGKSYKNFFSDNIHRLDGERFVYKLLECLDRHVTIEKPQHLNYAETVWVAGVVGDFLRRKGLPDNSEEMTGTCTDEDEYLLFVREQLGLQWPHIVEKIDAKWEIENDDG